ncbi:phage tail length tape measure family protein [Pelagibacterium sp. H642]|uniref:phage tail length tape measure family protein n=1 Tax=Pelagibacterium sp. H642 TaxID=1881069 RepID=UPI0028167DDD|nr:phage tail length tape measure family protein [Pelagibacterium sp. H642]WMT90160.1 phage tail length tape measure family protein [Pelagibacterium sp. H642]
MEADRVTVVLEAQTRQYLADLNKADADFKRVAGNVEREALSMGTSAQVGANAAASAFARAGNAANSMNIANVAAQFQDIGVTAAMGMNPMIVALQQGTQLSAVLNQSVAAGVSPARMLGQAFAQIINPISLATIATVALGTAALHWLGNVQSGARTANEAIRAHREALSGIVEGYSSAEEAVEQYFDAIDRLPQAIATERTREEFAQLQQVVDDFRARIDNLTDYLLDAESGTGQLGREIGEVVRRFRDGEISAEDFYRELQALESRLGAVDVALGNMGLGLGAIINELQVGTEATLRFGNAINSLIASSHALAGIATNDDLSNILQLDAYIAEQERLNALTADQLALEREIAAIMSEAGSLGMTEEEATRIAEDRLAAEERRAEIAKEMRQLGSGLNREAEKAEREAQAVRAFIASLEHERSLLGMTNEERAVANALRAAGATATERQRETIESLVLAIEGERAAIAQADEQMQQLRDSARSAMETIIDGFIEGKDAGDIFSAVLSDIASQLINMGLNSIFGSGNDFGLFGQMFNIPGRQYGGDVRKGQPYIVGEKRPELFIPDQNGTIVPSVPTLPSIGGGGATSVTFAPVIDARGADVAAVARLEQVVARQQAEFDVRVQRIVRSRGKKWID